MQPMNYTIQTPNSGKMLSEALTIAGQVAQRDQFLANADKARAEQQRIAAETAAAEQKRQELFALAQNPNRTSKDFENFMLRHGEINKQFQDQFQTMQESEQRQSVAVMSLVREGLKNKRPDVVVAELDRQIEAAKNSNNPAAADKLDMVRNMVLADPNAADLTANFFLRANMDPVKYEEMVGKRGAEERAQELQPSAVRKSEAEASEAEVKAKYAEQLQQAGITEKVWNVNNLKNQIAVRGAQLKLDRERLAMDTTARMAEVQSKLTEVPAGAQKLVNDAAVTASAAKQQAATYSDLSARITTMGTSWGAIGSANEWLKKAAGMQDGVTALRQEYTRLRNSAAVASLPPGPATDKDIQMVLEGFPPPNASPQVLSSFLRGMAKIKDIESSVEGAKVDWLANNRGVLTRANGNFRAGEFSVGAGESFSDFSSRVAKEVSAKYTPPTPAASQDNAALLREAEAIIRGGR